MIKISRSIGGVTGAGAKITGAVGDVFAKLSFDDKFMDKRQQEKTRPPRLGMKLGGFAKVAGVGASGTSSYFCCSFPGIYVDKAWEP